jgi:hypothetical protein
MDIPPDYTQLMMAACYMLLYVFGFMGGNQR